MTKIKTQELIKIIKKMTPSEKNRFRDSVTEINKKSNFYKLYELIEKSPEIVDSMIRGLFENETIFYDSKKYLYNRICEIMVVESARTDDELGSIYSTQLAYVFYKKGFYDLSESILKKLVKEQTTFVEAGIQTMVSILLARVGFVKQDLQLLKYSDSKFQEIIKYIDLVEKYRSFKIVTDPKFNNIDKNEIELYEKDESSFKSTRDLNGYYYFMALLYELKFKDFPKAYVYHKKAFNLYFNELKPNFKTISLQNTEVALIILNHYVISSINNNKYQEAEQGIKELLFFTKQCRYDNSFIKKAYLITLNCYSMKTGNLIELCLSETTKYANLLKPTSSNTIDLNIILYNSINLFLKENYKAVIRNYNTVFGLFKNMSDEDFFPFYIIYSNIIVIFSHIKLQHLDIIEKLINQLKLESFVDKPVLSELINIIFEFSDFILNRAANSINTKISMAEKILLRCENFQNSDSFKIYPFFDIKQWIGREITI